MKAKKGEARAWVEAHMYYKGNDCLIFPFAPYKPSNKKPVIGVIHKGKKKRIYVSKFMCSVKNGPPRYEDDLALHECGNGKNKCVNPNHLYWGSATNNRADFVAHAIQRRNERT